MVYHAFIKSLSWIKQATKIHLLPETPPVLIQPNFRLLQNTITKYYGLSF